MYVVTCHTSDPDDTEKLEVPDDDVDSSKASSAVVPCGSKISPSGKLMCSGSKLMLFEARSKVRGVTPSTPGELKYST